MFQIPSKKKTPYSWKVVFSDGFGTFLLLGITRTRYYLKSGWANSFSIDLVFFNWKVLIGHTWVYDNLDFWPYNWKIKIFKPFSTNQNFPQFCYDMTKEKTLAHLNLSNFAIFIYTLMLRWKGNQVFSILSRLWWNLCMTILTRVDIEGWPFLFDPSTKAVISGETRWYNEEFDLLKMDRWLNRAKGSHRSSN